MRNLCLYNLQFIPRAVCRYFVSFRLLFMSIVTVYSLISKRNELGLQGKT